MSLIHFFLKRHEDKDALDKNQEEYRKTFGIIDQYLIHFTDDKFIIYIDWQDDIDWIDNRDLKKEGWTQEDIDKYHGYLARLDALQSSPSTYLPHNIIMTFKKMLGSAYVMVMEHNFLEVDNIIAESQLYLDKRNKETSRYLYLLFSGFITIALITLMIVSHYLKCDADLWIDTITFGSCGAFVSVWQRYGKINYTGLSSKRLHILEASSRLFVGTIFAVVVVLLMKCKLILTQINPAQTIYAYMLLSFVAGFSERFVPSLMEKFVNENNTEKK